MNLSKLASLALLLLVVPTVGVFALANGSLLDSASAQSAETPPEETADIAVDVVVDAPVSVSNAEPLVPTPEPTTAPPVLHEADLELSTIVDNASPTIGGIVTFTITLENASGTGDATEVGVLDLLPAGVSYASHSTDQGSYEPTLGTWDVGTVSMGARVSLAIVAAVTSTSAITNYAEVVAVAEEDPDSTPNNHLPTEDDQDAVSLAALPKPELELSASLYEATGNLVVLALVLTNSGPSAANDIAVKSMPPAGLRYTGHVAQQGDYDPLTGVWSVGTVEGGAELTLHIIAIMESVATG
ncbi:MAG: DUF11 domain-containing protein [Chloroflexi bacterium]|nr:DUF11 domain-containing protein [Chloroflexota bacterium]